MGLKDEIRQLRGELDAGADKAAVEESVAETVRKGAAKAQEKVEEGLDAVGKTVREARARVEEVTDPEYLASVRGSLSASLGQVGTEIERLPAKYPTLTALTALGFGVALGLSLGRRLR